MAAKPEATPDPLEEEVEGNVEGTDDLVFCRLGDPVRLKPGDSSYDLARPPYQPLELSGRHRLLFLAHSQGFLVTRTRDVIELAKDMRENGKSGCVEDVSIVDVEIGAVSILSLSNDCSVLAAAVAGEVNFFSVTSLLNKEKKPSSSCLLGESETVKDLKWQKNMEKSFLVLSRHGLLKHGYLDGHLKEVMDDIDAVDWSVRGDYIAVARKSTLCLLSSNFKEQKQMSLLFQTWSDDADSECLNKVDSIKWVRDDSIIVGCVRINEDGKEEGYLVQVITSGDHGFLKSSSKPVVFSFPELFQDIVDDMLPAGCGPCFLVSYLERWEVALASNKKTIDQHLQLLHWSVDDNITKVVSLENQHEKYTPTIGLKENGDDNLILGFVVDKFSIYEKVKVQVGTEVSELSPYCIVLCLTAEGKLMMFHAARFSDPADLAQSSVPPLDDYSGVEERLSMFNPSENELNVISRSNDDLAGVTSSSQPPNVCDTGKDLPSVESFNESELMTGGTAPAKKEQGNTKSMFGIQTGQVSSLGGLHVQSTHMQGSGSALRNNTKSGVLELNLSSAERCVGNSSLGGIPVETSAASQVSITFSAKGTEVAKEHVDSTGVGRALSGLQSTGKFLVPDDIDAKSSSPASNRLMPGDSRGNVVGIGNKPSFSLESKSTNTFPSGGKPFSLKPSPSTLMFSSNKTNQKEGHKSPWTSSRNADSVPTTSGSPLLAQESSVSGKSIGPRMQQLVDNARIYKSSQTLASEPELSKQFYDVKDMTKELDTLLSFIEQGGGFRDACTVLQKDSLLALEEGLVNLSETLRICRNKIEEKLGEIQQLQNKMLQVSTRQVYMEGIVKQASDQQYWEIWNQQKLNPELELKRQQILKLNQNLTNQLIELERHFNSLEISKFGESGRGPIGRRAFHSRLEPARKMQSLQSVYNTLNSQLAVAEQLSECLSKQMAALNINPPSAKRRNATMELFESIGLAHEADIFQMPNVKSPWLTPTTDKRISTSMAFSAIKEYPRGSTASASKSSPETARRRRNSLDKNLANFEPQKTTVKRISQEVCVKENADKPIRKSMEAFDSRIEEFASIQRKRNDTSSSFKPSIHKFPPHAYPTNEGAQEGPSKQASETQSNSLFKWTKDLSASSQTLESKSSLMQELQQTAKPSPPRMSSPSLYGNAQNNMRSALSLPTIPSIGAAHTKSQSDSSTIKIVRSSKTTSNMQFDTSTSAQTSLKFSSTILPKMTASALKQVEVQAGKQYTLKGGEDGLTRLSPGSTNPLAVTLQESSLSSQFSSFAVPSGTSHQVDGVTGRGQSNEVVSLVTSHPIVSSSPSFLDAPSSAVVTSSPVSTPASLSFSPTSSTATAFGGSSLRTIPAGETSRTVSVSSTSSIASTTSSVLMPFQLQKSSGSQHSTLPSESTTLKFPPSRANEASSKSEPAPSLASASSKSEREAPASEALVGSVSEKVPSSLLNVTGSMFSVASSSPEMPSAPVPSSSSLSVLKDEGLDVSSSQEDDMEEEAPDTSTVLNLGALGGFGLGSAPSSSTPKLNPFGGSFGMATSTAVSAPPAFTSSPGELFRPASFSLPSVQPVQPSQPMGSGPFSGGPSGGFSGFGQPAQIGQGQQALGSVLGAFGQSRQLGTGVPAIGFAPSGSFGVGGFSAAANSGGFASSGFAGSATGGGFAALASSGGGFAGAAAGGGFAALASSSSGFAAASTGGGFATLASSGSGFAAPGSGFGGAGPGSGFKPGGFGSFSSNQGSNQGGGFSAFGGSSSMGPGRPPAELLTQMRK